jgi:hypothetical protein
LKSAFVVFCLAPFQQKKVKWNRQFCAVAVYCRQGPCRYCPVIILRVRGGRFITQQEGRQKKLFRKKTVKEKKIRHFLRLFNNIYTCWSMRVVSMPQHRLLKGKKNMHISSSAFGKFVFFDLVKRKKRTWSRCFDGPPLTVLLSVLFQFCWFFEILCL